MKFESKYGLNDYIEYLHNDGSEYYIGRIISIAFDADGSIQYTVYDGVNCDQNIEDSNITSKLIKEGV